jgi:hypothetical protein
MIAALKCFYGNPKPSLLINEQLLLFSFQRPGDSPGNGRDIFIPSGSGVVKLGRKYFKPDASLTTQFLADTVQCKHGPLIVKPVEKAVAFN